MKVRQGKKPVLSRSAIHQFGVDGRLWRDMCDESTRLREAVEQGAVEYGTWPELMSDTFLTLYKPDPQLMEPDHMDPVYRSHHPIVKTLQEDPAVQTLREDTQLNDMLAAVGTLTLTDTLRKALEKDEDLKKWWQDQWETAQTAHESNTDANDGGKDNAVATLGDMPPGVQKALRVIIHQAIAEAEQQVEQTEAVFRTWGHESKELQALPIEERLQLADRLRATPKLKDIARLVGRLKNLRRGLEARNMMPGHEEIFGVTQGSHLDRTLPSELAYLSHPLARRLFQARFVEHQLLEYALRGREPASLGPMIILVDLSGSTKGTVEIWEKGLALALVAEAQRQKRAAMVIGYDTKVRATVTWPVQCNNAQDLTNIEQTAAMWTGGGTNWTSAIQRGLELTTETAWKRADLVLLTDGKDDDLPPNVRQILDAQRQRGLRLFAAVIGQTPPAFMHDWSDQVVNVHPHVQHAENVFRLVLKPTPEKGESGDGHYA